MPLHLKSYDAKKIRVAALTCEDPTSPDPLRLAVVTSHLSSPPELKVQQSSLCNPRTPNAKCVLEIPVIRSIGTEACRIGCSQVNEINHSVQAEISNIPLRLFSFIHTKSSLPEKMRANWESTVRENSEFNCQLFDLDEARNFILTHFDADVLSAFDTLKPYSYKSDLFRFCCLYVHGGIYVDIKYKSVNGFRFIQLIDQEYLTKEPLGTQTCLIALRPGSSLMKDCIDEIARFTSTRQRASTPLFTGPYLLSNIHSKLGEDSYLNKNLQWSIENHLQSIQNRDGNVILTQYCEYREDLNAMENPQSHYSSMFWNNDEYNAH